MSHGRALASASIPVMFQCVDCCICVTVHYDVGKDYIFEDAVRFATYELAKTCGWDVDANPGPLCAGCKR